MPFESRFNAPGSLPPPRWVGRGVRLLMGVACLFAVASLATAGGRALVPGPPDPVTWGLIALAVWLLPAVVDIGWGVRWKRRSQWAVLVAGVALAIAGWLTKGEWWPASLGWLVLAVTLYTFAHLGVSFVLSAVLATPGCEMRALPHLWGLVTGRGAREHYCPGFLDGLDRWEARRAGSS